MVTNLFIIDDDPIFRIITARMIEKLDVQTLALLQCEDGAVGLNALERISGSCDKIIVFLDLNMPVIDGWNFLDKLRQNKNYNINNITIYIVSSSTDDSDILKAKSHNIVKQFIHKPMTLDIIKKIVTEN